MKRKILIVTPRSPFQGRGADELDRLSGIKWFIKERYDVRVVTKIMPNDRSFILEAEKELEIFITPISYKYNSHASFFKKIVWYGKRIWPPYWDGASYEYFDSEIQVAVAREIAIFKPDMVWFDYTYLWPLYKLVPKNIPIYTRSINFEPTHFLDEDGRWPWNYVKVVPKFLSEWLVSKKSKVVFAITPKEQNIYQRLGASSVTLPLRGLSQNMNTSLERQFIQKNEIHLGFTASTYSVQHNLKALVFILRKVLPILRKGETRYIFHFTGSRLPDSLKASLSMDDVYEGFVPSMSYFWDSIDIAIVPSLFGAGMQQKVFEPLARGVPTVTSKRAMAGYEFGTRELLFADTASQYISAINELSSDASMQKTLSTNARDLSIKLFADQPINKIIRQSII